MRGIVFLSLITLFVISCRDRSIRTNFESGPGREKTLQTLFDKREYFDLRDTLAKHQGSISPARYQFFSAFVQNGFNQNALSVKTINDLMNADHKLPDSLIADLMLLQRDNYIKMFDYKNAAAIGKQVIEQFGNVFDERKIHAVKNKNKIYEGLIHTPAQKTIVTKNGSIEWKRDKVGLMTVPVATGTSIHDFIFDTRAGISVIMRSYAGKLKLRMLGVRYMEGSGITGKSFEAELGIADSLMVGDIKVYNVVFQVLPDEILSFPSMDYYMKGIVGFPVIAQWRHLRINQNGIITVLNEPDTALLQNLAFDESAIVLSARADDEMMSFYLDSGANHSELFSNYFLEKEAMLKQTARVDTVEVGGVGGTQKKQVYTLPAFTLQVGDKQAELNDIQVLTKPTYQGQRYYGNIGQDLLTQFTEITLDFDGMSLTFK
jgi:hypothetical protein